MDRLARLLFPPLCPGCSAPVSDPVFCSDCQILLQPACWQLERLAIYSCAAYSAPIKRAVLDLKEKGLRSHAEVLAGCMSRLLTPTGGTLLPVPSSAKKQLYRGYQPAALLAAELARTWGLECRTGVLSLAQAGLPQKKRSAAERRRLELECLAEPPERVILVDDVVTTGSTLLACRQQLEVAGSRVDLAICFARTELQDGPKGAAPSSNDPQDR